MKVLSFGSCNIDYVYSLDHIVRPGETTEAHSVSKYPGGKIGCFPSFSVWRCPISDLSKGQDTWII